MALHAALVWGHAMAASVLGRCADALTGKSRRVRANAERRGELERKREAAMAGGSIREYRRNPRFCVIITSFNQKWNVPNIVERLAANPYVSEVVVCEDGSIDGSLDEYVATLQAPNHFVQRSNDLHEIRAIDRAVRTTRAEIVCIIQDDDVVPADHLWVKEALDEFARYPRLGVYGAFAAYMSPPKDSGDPKKPDFSFKDSILHKRVPFRFVASVNVGPYFMRTACYSQMGGFDLCFSKPGQAGVGFDEEFGFRCWLNGWQCGYMHQPFKTGVEGEYNLGAGGTFTYGAADERLSHDRENKILMINALGQYHDKIVDAVRRSNAAAGISDVAAS